MLLAGSISGTVFSDYNSNGAQDSGEPGLEGWTVYVDADNDSIADPSELKQVTNAAGFYEFPGLEAPAQHIIRQVLPAGWSQTHPGSGGVILGGGGGEATSGSPAKSSGKDTSPSRKASPTEIVVAFEGKRGRSALAQRLRENAGLRRLADLDRSRDMFTVKGATLVEVKLHKGINPRTAAERFAALPGVRWAQPNYVYDDMDPREFLPSDPEFVLQYHHTLMQNHLAWDTTLGSADILIGVTDDGVLLDHPDLVDNLWTNPGEIAGNSIDDDGNGKIDDVHGWDVWDDDNDPSPTDAIFDHGTHVAGIAAARTDNGVGVSGISNSTIVPIKFWGSGGTWTSTIVSDAYRYAADVGVHIVNTSYNVDGFTNDNIFAAALQYMYDQGVLHFNSAGNSGQLDPPRQKWDQSLFVVNTTSADVRNGGSNWGWGMDLSAPGTGILSTSFGANASLPNYEIKTGTSMATPAAAGVAALIWSAHPDWTREQVAAQLLGTADNIDAQNPGAEGKLGAGRVNALRALAEQLAAPRMRSLAGLPGEGASVTAQPFSFSLDVASIFDPATMVAANFELRGAGLDGVFDTADDTLQPLVLTFGSSHGDQYMIGTNRLNFLVGGMLPPDTYRFSALPGLTDPFGQALDGNGDGTAGDAYARTFTLLPVTGAYTVNLADGQAVTDAHFGVHDVAAPRVLGASFAYATAHAIVVQFNDDVSGTLDLTDLLLEELTSEGPVDTAEFTVSYDAETHTATFHVNGILADGRYRATFAAAGIADASGNALDADGNGDGGDDLVIDFHFMQGDANNDGTVNLIDFNVLAANFGQSPRDFTQGDFNYDGVVNLSDFNILADRFGSALPSVASTGPSLLDDAPGGGDSDGDDRLAELA